MNYIRVKPFRHVALLLSCVNLALSLPSMAAEADEGRPVLSTPDFSVSELDFFRYLEERSIVSEEDRQRVLSRPGAVRATFENILVIEAIAHAAEEEPAIDRDDISWRVENYRNRLMMNAYLDLRIAEAMAGVDYEMAAYEDYLANRESFVVPESVLASHILVSTENRTLEEARTIAEGLKSRLDNGEDFSELARQYSNDETSAARGGYLGMFRKGRMVPEFEEAAFALREPGELSPLVETEFGVHIIKLDEYRGPRQREFEEVKSQLITAAQARLEAQKREELIGQVKRGEWELDLDVDEELLGEIEARYVDVDAEPAVPEELLESPFQ